MVDATGAQLPQNNIPAGDGGLVQQVTPVVKPTNGQGQAPMKQAHAVSQGAQVTPTDGTGLRQADQDQVVQPTPTAGVGLGDKEKEPLGRGESVPLVELSEHHEMEPEVEGWIEHLQQDHEIKLPEPIKDGDKIVVANAGEVQVEEDRLVLPMTQTGVQRGMSVKVVDSARWLAEWCTRLIKVLGSKVKYREN